MRPRDQWIDPILADQLDRDLELIRMGRLVNPTGPRFGTAHTAAEVYAVDTRDVEPDPSAEFVRLLGERLTGTIPAAAIGDNAARTSFDTVRHPAGSVISRWAGEVVSFRAAAAFVLIVTTTLAVVGLRGQGSGDDDRPMLPASLSEATALPATSSVPLIQEAVDTAECNSIARPPGTVAALTGTIPSTSDALPRQPTSGQDRVIEPSRSDVDAMLNGLPAASREETDGVKEALRQLSACRFTLINPFGLFENVLAIDPYDDYDGRFYGLYSDDYFRRGLNQTAANFDLPVLGVQWIPIGPLPPVLQNPRRLYDGRVIAVIQPGYPNSRAPGSVIVFARSGERWLIDEYIGIQAENPAISHQGQSATPAAAGQWPQFLEIALRDDGGITWDAPTTNGRYRANQDVYVTLANAGKLPHHFEIPDLGIQITVPPGHSVSFVLNASEGSYTYRSFTTPAGTNDLQGLDDRFQFVPEGISIPMG